MFEIFAGATEGGERFCSRTASKTPLSEVRESDSFMPPPFERHVFVCTNRRPDGSPKGCCASKGSEELVPALKRAIDAAGVKNVRINKAGCLDACERGAAVVVYPEGVWYQKVTEADVQAIAEEHLRGGTPVGRLLMEPYPKATK